MTFLIVNNVAHKHFNGAYYAYGSYIKDMNLWINKKDELFFRLYNLITSCNNDNSWFNTIRLQ